MALPANSTFAMNTKHKQDQEKEEKLELKKLVLKSVEDGNYFWWYLFSNMTFQRLQGRR